MVDPVLKFTLREDKRTKREIFFRYDSPVLIVSATWHDTVVPYGQTLRDALLRKYAGNEDAVSAYCGNNQ